MLEETGLISCETTPVSCQRGPMLDETGLVLHETGLISCETGPILSETCPGSCKMRRSHLRNFNVRGRLKPGLKAELKTTEKIIDLGVGTDIQLPRIKTIRHIASSHGFCADGVSGRAAW